MPLTVVERTTCRSCAGDVLEPVLDLGNLAVSDFVTDPAAEPDRAPLELVRCFRCGLVQLRHSVERDRLYRTYHYRSGTNETMVAALKDVVDAARRIVELRPADWVLDIGSNDSTLLDQYPAWVRTVGFEPSDVRTTEGRHFVVHDYFPPAKYPVAPKQAKIITAVAMFYDLDDPGAFLEEVKRWLHPQGVLVVQLQDLDAMLRCNGFDNICHEHVTYWTEATLGYLLHRHGLRISHSERVKINGGSTRFYVRWGTDPADDYVDDEGDRRKLREFAAKTEALKYDTFRLLAQLRAEGHTVYGIAASTKFNTLAQYYGLGPELIHAIGERSRFKWGKYTVGTNIPIISEEALRAARPAFLFCCAWQFAEAFAERERALLAQGTKLIVPLPTLRVVGVDGADVLKAVA